MSRLLRYVVGFHVISAGPLCAQRVPAWKVAGDTSGAPPECSAAAGIAAINAWFDAYNRADSANLRQATAAVHNGRFVFSTGKFTPTDTFVAAHTLQELVAYVRKRAAKHERLTVQAVTFNSWRGEAKRGLQFGPIYFMRSADDLGKEARPGIGKGEYWCNAGVSILNMAPRPAHDRGPGLIGSLAHRLTQR